MGWWRCERVGVIVGLVGVVVLVGCGGGSSSSSSSSGAGGLGAGVVASVGSRVVSEAVLDHWVSVQAVTDYDVSGQHPAPVGVVPDPPRFAGCIALLRAGGHLQPGTPAKPVGKISNSELLGLCESTYKGLREHVLSILLSWAWWQNEAAALGISVPEEEVARKFAVYRDGAFKSALAYKRYLEVTGQSLADEYLRERMDIITLKLLEHFQAQGQLEAYDLSFSRKWAEKTTCRAGDIVPNCSEYHGATPPEARI
jgi:hypothetical protein